MKWQDQQGTAANDTAMISLDGAGDDIRASNSKSLRRRNTNKEVYVRSCALRALSKSAEQPPLLEQK